MPILRRLLLFCWGLIPLLLSAAGPSLINIQFGVDATPLKVGSAAYGVATNDVWNRYSRDDGHGGYKAAGALTNLTLADGTASGVGVFVTNAPGAIGNGYSDAMFGTYLYNFDGSDLTVTVTNLPAGTYTVYAYGHGEQDTFNSAFQVSAGGVNYGVAKTATNATWRSLTWIEGAQYVKFAHVVVSAGQPLVLTASHDGVYTPIINGLQLVAEPDRPVVSVPLLNVQFGVDATTLKSGPAAYGLAPNDVWNLYSRDDGHGGYKTVGAVANLKSADGTLSGVGLAITNAPGAIGNGYPDAMFGTYLYNFDGADLTVSLSNLPAGTYTLYAYGHGEQDTFNSAFQVSAGGVSYGAAKTATNATWRSLTWIEGAQYVKFANIVVAAGQALVLTASHDGVYTPIINGLQLVRQPEPPALFNVQFGVDTTTVKSGPAAYGLATNDVWNLYSRDDGHGGYKVAGALTNLKSADGAVSGVGLTITNAPGAIGNGYPDAMFGTYLYNFNGADLTVTLSDLPAGTYTLYAYGHGEQDTFNSAFQVSSAGVNYGAAKTTTTASWRSLTWIEGAQYVKFANIVVPAGQKLVLTASHDGVYTPIINGLQLVRQPPQPVSAVQVNVQFGVDTTPVKTGPAAYGLSTNDVWNLYSRDDGHGGYKASGALTNLTLADGTTAGVGLTITNAPGAWGTGYPDAMFGTYLYNFNGDDLTVTLSNLPAGGYTVYAYGHGEQNSFNTAFRASAAGADYGVAKTTTTSTWNSPTWIEGAQYVKFTNIVVPAGQALVLTGSRDGTGTPIINGLQVVRDSLTAVAISPVGGLFTNSLSVTLVGTAVGAFEIHYTLDGTDPVAASPVYLGSLHLGVATTIKAALFQAGLPVSGVVSAHFDRVYALNDGISAEWRLRYFGAGYLTDPRVAADADPDHDGATNFQEFVAGSDPLDPLSGFAVAIKRVPSITWASVPGKTYRVLRKQTVNDPSWTVLKEVTATEASTRFTDESVTADTYIYSIQPVL